MIEALYGTGFLAFMIACVCYTFWKWTHAQNDRVRLRRAAADRYPIRPQPTETMVDATFREIRENLKRRLDQHGHDGFAGKAEGLGIITEEFWELVEAVRSDDIDLVSKESSDLAVGCAWMIATIKAKKNDELAATAPGPHD